MGFRSWPLVVALCAACAFQSAARAADAPLLSVTVAHPLTKRITTWDEYSGRFVAVKSVEVRPRVSGFIDKVNFMDGATVKAGDLLFTIDQRPFAIAVESAKAEVAHAVAQVKLTTADVERAKPLLGTNAISARDFDQRAAGLAVAQAQLQVAQAARKAAELNFEWTEVRAPISGRISDKKVDEGNLVNGGSGSTTLLATIVSLDPIQFLFEASEGDYLRYTRANLSGHAVLARRQQSRAHEARRRDGVDACRQDGFRRQPARSAHRHNPRAGAPRKQGSAVYAGRVSAALSSLPATSMPF